jgi:hypothetical protein
MKLIALVIVLTAVAADVQAIPLWVLLAGLAVAVPFTLHWLRS